MLRTPLLFAAFVLLILGPWSGRARGEDQAKDVVVIHSFVDLVHEEEIADLDQVVHAIVSEAGVATPLKGQPGMFVVKAPAQVQSDLALTIDILRRTLRTAHLGESRQQLVKRALDEAVANGRTLSSLRTTFLDLDFKDASCSSILLHLVIARSFNAILSVKGSARMQETRASLVGEHVMAREALDILMKQTGLTWALAGRGVLRIAMPEELAAREVPHEAVPEAAQVSTSTPTSDVREAIRALHEEVRALRAEVAALAETLRRDG